MSELGQTARIPLVEKGVEVARVRVKVPFEKVDVKHGHVAVPAVNPLPPVDQPVLAPELSVKPQRTAVTLSRRTLIVFVIGFGLLLLLASRTGREPITDTNATPTLGSSTDANTEAREYFTEVSKYVELPADELPKVLNVADASEVKKDNLALTDIKDGDKMLFFTKARKLVVYRPSTKKIVAAISLATQASTAPQQTPETVTPNN